MRWASTISRRLACELGAGSRVENVNVTPELCREWLGFVAPMLADAADVNGQLSMRVERFLWDLNAPQNSDVSGQADDS